MPALLEGGRIGALKVRGEGLKANLAKAVTGSPTLDLSVDQVSQLIFVLDDPGLSIYESGIFDDRARIDYGSLDFEVAATEVAGASGDPIVTVTARSRGAQKMKRAKGALVMRDISPTGFAGARARAHNLEFVGEPSAKRAQVVRADPKGDQPESDWTACQRLARELGYWMFEAAGTLYFGRPKWLLARGREFTVHYPRARTRDELSPSQVPTCRRSVDAEEGKGRSIDLLVGYEDGGRSILPGSVVEFGGIRGYAGLYIVTGVNFTLQDDSDVAVSLATPIDPKPEPPEAKSTDLDGDGIADLTGGAVEESSGSRSDQASSAGFTWPVAGTVISGFGQRSGGMHYGIDIACAEGTRCKAAKGGEVKFVAYDAEGYGHWVEVDHGGGVSSRYGHLSKATVSVGQRVERGAVIGYTDTTGNAQGPHLHFETRRGGQPFDPTTVLP